MKHVMYAEKSLMMGDEVADLMMEYAVLLARHRSATIMVAETARSSFPEPENGCAVTYLKKKIGLIRAPPFAHGLDDMEIRGFEDEV